jgi:TM2 domain-containing membrane protein YozV
MKKGRETDFQKAMTFATSTSLCFLVPGFGQMRLGEFKNGLVILIVGIGLVISSRLAPLEIVIIPMLIFYIWQIYDTFRLCNKRYPSWN